MNYESINPFTQTQVASFQMEDAQLLNSKLEALNLGMKSWVAMAYESRVQKIDNLING